MKIGTVVVFLAGEDHVHNGTREHPAIVTRVWGDKPPRCVNLKVFPDCGEPFDATSVRHYKDTGWPLAHCYREV